MLTSFMNRGLALAVSLILANAGSVCAQFIDLGQISEAVVPSTDTLRSPAELAQSHRGRLGHSTPVSEGAVADDALVLSPLQPAAPVLDFAAAGRLSGEVSRARFSIYLPAVSTQAVLELAHKSAIDVLPNASSLSVRLNETDLGTVTLDNFADFATDKLSIPAGTLRPGYNSVEIVARHAHRIACGPDAGFDLWTEIDLRVSGVSIPQSAFPLDPAGFMAAAAVHAASGRPIYISQPADHEDQAELAGRLPGALNMPSLKVEPRSLYAAPLSSAETARIVILPDEIRIAGPQFRRGGDGAVVMLLPAHVDPVAMLETTGFIPEEPPVEGRPAVEPGGPIALETMAEFPLRAEGHYATAAVPVVLPGDWLVLTGEKAQLDLLYRHSAGQPAGSKMLVKVNGVSTQLLPLDLRDQKGERSVSIRFEASLLRPGRNELQFEVFVEGNPPDQACTSSDLPWTEILGATTLNVPSSPKLSLPSIDHSLAGIAPADVTLTASVRDAGMGSLPEAVISGLPDTEGAEPGAHLTVATLADLDELYSPILSGSEYEFRASFSRRGSLRVETEAQEIATTFYDATLTSAGGYTSAMPPTALIRRLLGRQPSLRDWLSDMRSEVALVQPDPTDPGKIWLLVGDETDIRTVSTALHAALHEPNDLRGQVAIYNTEDGWHSWTAPHLPLRLHEPITVRNFRVILGTLAVLNPESYVALVFTLTALAALLAVGILKMTRGKKS